MNYGFAIWSNELLSLRLYPSNEQHFNFRLERGAHSSGRLNNAAKPREHDENLHHNPCL